MKEHECHDIAQIQLHEAIRFYNEKNYICATTLSGAAAEILSKLVTNYSDATSYREKTILTILNDYPNFDTSLINEGRNMLKHLNEKYFEKPVNLKHSALSYILISIGDYFILQEKITKTMSAFWKQHSNYALNINTEREN